MKELVKYRLPARTHS